jgi:hypothetical protein
MDEKPSLERASPIALGNAVSKWEQFTADQRDAALSLCSIRAI